MSCRPSVRTSVQNVIVGLFLVMVIRSESARAEMVLTPETEGYVHILEDWKLQDEVAERGLESATESVIASLPEAKQGPLAQQLDGVSDRSDESAALLGVYIAACSARREKRLSPCLEKIGKIVFSQQDERPGIWHGPEKTGGYEGKGLELLEFEGLFGTVTHLLPEGVARDPEVSFDGKKILFAWNNSSGNDRYHIYEMDLSDNSIRQITDGDSDHLTDYDDIEPIYLPNGNILFHSSRQAQRTDCISTLAFNLFLCDPQGRYLRRVGYDQVSTCNPVLLPSGEVLYARWDYNDKSHVFGHALFTMRPDGTKQQEYYNNNSLFPTNVLHPRPIPGTKKIMATITGYHTSQPGEIAMIDNRHGYQNGAGLTFVSPVREIWEMKDARWGGKISDELYHYSGESFPYPKKGPIDRWKGEGSKSAYPYPLDDDAYLVVHWPEERQGDDVWKNKFGLYLMYVDGQRELLFFDPNGNCSSPVPLRARTVPPLPSTTVDYRDSMGVFQVVDVHKGQSMKGVEPGTVKRLRVVALYYRPGFTIGKSQHNGAVSSGGYNNPIATNNASWDVKAVIGETPVHDDGSANFHVPARVPVYFQALDAKGHTVQTMRSWATLQPGEQFSCTGCHESKNDVTPPPTSPPTAMQEAPRHLEPFYGPERGFSYVKEIQPIWDAKCVECHTAEKPNGINLEGTPVPNHIWVDGRDTHRTWLRSYINLVSHEKSAAESKYVNWFHAEDCPLLAAPYRAGACKSMLISLLEEGHKEVEMTREEMEKISCWIDLGVPHFGSYTEGVIGHESTIANALAKKTAWEEQERRNIEAYIDAGQPYGAPVSAHAGRAGIDRQTRSVRHDCRIVNGRLEIRTPHPAHRSSRSTISVYSLRGRLVFNRVLTVRSGDFLSVDVDLAGVSAGPVLIVIESGRHREVLRQLKLHP